MLSNYLKLAVRNLLRFKTFSLINLLGLTVGMISFLLIVLWIRDELSYDRFHESYDRLYRVMENQSVAGGEVVTQAEAPGLLGEALKAEVPGLAYTTTMDWWTNTLLSFENQSVKEDGRYVGADFLNMFSFPLLRGDRGTALSKPNSIVITQRLAERLFPGLDPMGKVLKVANFSDFQVTGVLANLPANTIFQFEFLLPYSDFIARNAWARNWDNNGLHTWVLLEKGVDVQEINKKIKNMVRSRGTQKNVDLFLQPLTDVYLKSDFKNGAYQGGGRMEYVRLFGIIAGLLLLIACINFINLSTARATTRAKEVGVRKISGAGRGMLAAQFLGEALLMCLLALAIALATVDALLPWFNTFSGKSVHVPYQEPGMWLGLAGIMLLTVVLAGGYPAFVISAFQPVAALKGGQGVGAGGNDRVWLRKTLVAGQFSIAVLLMICTITVYRQLQYLQTKPLGYNKERLLAVSMNHEIQSKYVAFKTDLERVPGVTAVTASHSSLTGYINATDQFEWEGKNPGDNIQFVYETVGHDYLSTIGAKLLEGRDFSAAHPADSANFILNETAVKRMNLAAPFSGQRVRAWGKEGQIIGVVKDYHFRSLKQQVEPLVLTMSNPFVWTAYARLDGKQSPAALRYIESLCKRYSPTYPFEYTFVDDDYNRLYQSEQTVSRLAAIFAILAIFISCLGLFGLATFATERRMKEIGIRKVLGATTAGIVGLLSGDFLKLVLIAIVPAAPVAWYLMERWLQDFAYRIAMPWWVFAAAGFVAVAVAFLTVSTQSARAALANPVRSLRSE